jgi:carboxylate-amine ligase
MKLLEFKASEQLTMGVELELQILNSRDYNLVRGASDLLAFLEKTPHRGEIKPEMTESMIEVNSSVHRNYGTLVEELVEIRDVITRQADRLNLRIAGGGAHPFQMWSDQRIYSTAEPSRNFSYSLQYYRLNLKTMLLNCLGCSPLIHLLEDL